MRIIIIIIIIIIMMMMMMMIIVIITMIINIYIYIYCIINRCVLEYNIRSFSRLIGKLAHRDSLISTSTLLLQSKDPFQKFFSPFTATWWRPHVASSVRSPVISR